MKLKIDQIAICPKDPKAAKALLEQMGAINWAKDNVEASGIVFDNWVESKARLEFNYGIADCKEFELLHYIEGDNWMEHGGRENSVSHFGMHCSKEELILWREFFKERGIGVAQEVKTFNHTNPVIAGKRWYHYVIFDTKEILGVDLKFIVRKNAYNNS